MADSRCSVQRSPINPSTPKQPVAVQREEGGGGGRREEQGRGRGRGRIKCRAETRKDGRPRTEFRMLRDVEDDDDDDDARWGPGDGEASE